MVSVILGSDEPDTADFNNDRQTSQWLAQERISSLTFPYPVQCDTLKGDM